MRRKNQRVSPLHTVINLYVRCTNCVFPYQNQVLLDPQMLKKSLQTGTPRKGCGGRFACSGRFRGREVTGPGGYGAGGLRGGRKSNTIYANNIRRYMTHIGCPLPKSRDDAYFKTSIDFFWHRWRFLWKNMWGCDLPLKYRGLFCEKEVPR